MTVAAVRLWGTTIGAVRWCDETGQSIFEYDQKFAGYGIEPSPLSLPLKERLHRTDGLPGLLKDALPGEFGETLAQQWYQTVKGRGVNEALNPVQRLQLLGRTAIGALEFDPPLLPYEPTARPLNIEKVVDLVRRVGSGELKGIDLLEEGRDEESDLFAAALAPGGQRPKALIAWNEETHEVLSGHEQVGKGFSYWILKLGGVTEAANEANVLEYCYQQVAQKAGVDVVRCELLEDERDCHFASQRFDRDNYGDKVHIQTLNALCEDKLQNPSWETVFDTLRQLGVKMLETEEIFRRVVFAAISGQNSMTFSDIVFRMSKRGTWTLAPAFNFRCRREAEDNLTLSINGKVSDLEFEDFKRLASHGSLKRSRVRQILNDVCDALTLWPEVAREQGVEEQVIQAVVNQHKLDILAG